MYEHPFTIKEVAWLLSIRCLEGGSDQEFPVECPYCGDTRGKCSFCISKNGEIKTFSIVSTAGRAEICLPCMQTLWGFMEKTGAKQLIRKS